jgi:hypothetical protein
VAARHRLNPPRCDRLVLAVCCPRRTRNVTYDGSPGPAKPGDARGAYTQGAQNVVGKIKNALTPEN